MILLIKVEQTMKRIDIIYNYLKEFSKNTEYLLDRLLLILK